VTFVLQVVHRVITRHLLGQAGLKADEADSGAVTLHPAPDRADCIGPHQAHRFDEVEHDDRFAVPPAFVRRVHADQAHSLGCKR
jgi:hypothetical protein